MKRVDGSGTIRPPGKVEAAKPEAPQLKYPTQPTVDRDKFSRGGRALKLRAANKAPERRDDPLADPPEETRRLAELERKKESGGKLTKDEARELLSIVQARTQRAEQRAHSEKVQKEAQKQRDAIVSNIRG